ncbi:MAG: hypothetical protein IM600_14825 [Bacteroidetes bacterium]|nr:hypothetical protein [Bacteroidota bacterium]MCA6444703.1 hypothetical protein [Bacteroidota bacterium]
MKKILVVLTTILTLSVNATQVAHYLYCTRAGQAWIMDQLGNSVPAGGCAGGPWAIQLDLVMPTGNPTVLEASPAIYDALNTPPSNPSATPSDEELDEMRTAINKNPVKVWVNPLRLTAAAYAIIYGGTSNLPLFFANTSSIPENNGNLLSLYSNGDREITITYKRIDLTTIGSEKITVVRGSNSKPLNTETLPDGTYVITISTKEGYSVNLTIYVNH